MIGVPMIVVSVVNLLARPAIEVAGLPLTPAIVALIAAGIYYLLLDFALGLCLVRAIGVMAWMDHMVATASTPTWLTAGIGMFVVGWIIQFVGHHYEGACPRLWTISWPSNRAPVVLAEVMFQVGARRTLRAAIEARVGPPGLRDLRCKTSGAAQSKSFKPACDLQKGDISW